MQKWEYHLFQLTSSEHEKTMQEINEFGLQGWRVVPISTAYFGILMERQVLETKKAIPNESDPRD